ncbi:MAG: response regulator transcription factor [Pseudomonadota bacterium]
MRVAIVEDNLPLSNGIAQAFRDDGHGVDQLHDGGEAMAILAREPVDLVILDINLPGASGIDVLSGMRQAGNQVPVLMLTARAAQSDKIIGLDLGADDYLTKPFDLEELKARARALMRRSGLPLFQHVVLGDLILDTAARRVSLGGEVLDLPRREFALAEILLLRQGHVISKHQIIEHLYGAGADVEENAVEIYVHRLRKRFRSSSVEIRTVRGLGYTLQEVK